MRWQNAAGHAQIKKIFVLNIEHEMLLQMLFLLHLIVLAL
jgi:hypothetical protein